MVHLVPDGPVAPLDGAVRFLGVGRVGLVEHVDVVVGGHGGQDLGGALGALRVHVAPPEDRLDPAQLAHPAVVAHHVAQLGVHPSLDPVVGPGHRALRAKPRVEVGEHGAGVEQRRQAAAGLDEPLVGVDAPAVHHGPLVEEVAPELAPLEEPLDPEVGLAQRADVHEVDGQAVELLAGLEVGPRGGVAPDLAERVVQAPLHPGLRPLLARGRREAGPAVGDHHVRRRDAGEQRLPRALGLPARHVPRQHVVVAAGDEHHQVAGDVDAVDVDDAVDLVDDLGHGPDLPEPAHPAPEGPPAAGHVALPLAREQPAEEGLELPGVGVVAVHGRGAAGRAAPPLRARLGLAVTLHLGPARGACRIIHGHSSESGDFFAWFTGYHQRKRL